MAVATVEME